VVTKLLWLMERDAARAQELKRALMAWGIEVELGPTRPARADLILATPQDIGQHTHPDWVAMTQTPELPDGASMYVLASLKPEAMAEALMLERQARG